MTSSAIQKDHFLFILCLALSTIIFIIDLRIPLGVATGVLYVITVLLALRSDKYSLPLLFALSGSFLTILGYYYSSVDGTQWMVITNRVLSLVAIWITYLLGHQLKNTNYKLEQSVYNFLQFAKQSPAMIWYADIQGNWFHVSKTLQKFTGIPLTDLSKMDWLNAIHPDQREKVALDYQELVKNQQAMQVECQIKSTNNDYCWVLIQANQCYSKANEVSAIVGTIVDIHCLKTTQEYIDDCKFNYYQKDKLAILGTLASGILHKLVNPVTSIRGLLEEIKIQDQGNNLTESYLAMALTEIARLEDISRDINNFTNLIDEKQQLYDINDLINRVCNLMQHDERMYNIQLSLNLSDNLPAVNILANQFIQVMQHLLSNAFEAITDNGKIEISSKLENNQLVFAVTDNGIGMDKQQLERIGEEFYTTKDNGVGLGVSLCKQIVEGLGGKLAYHSTPLKGCTAIIRLPLTTNII